MTNKWLMGTALAVLMTSGAVAQNAAQECRLDVAMGQGMEAQERFRTIDENGDGKLSREEYLNCLAANQITLDEGEQQDYLASFDRIDADADAALVIAEVEGVADVDTMAEARATRVDVEQKPATVAVSQDEPTVTVEQEQPTVTVQQPEPQVAVETKQPEVTVEQPEPEVKVTQPEPEVVINQPQPEIEVEQPQAQVAIEQPEPEVKVTQAQPEVAVEVRQPEVTVEQPDAEVSVTKAEPEVKIEQAEPKVVVQQAEPNVVIEKVSEVDADVEGATKPEATEVAALDSETSMETRTFQIAYDDMVGESVYNQQGEEIGDIEDILLDPETNSPVVLISVGGFLGIGDTDLVFPFDDISVDGDRVILHTQLGEDTLDDQIEYDEARYRELPRDMIR